MGFRYNATPATVGFDFNNPLTSDAFSTTLLHMENQIGQPYLSRYITEQICDFISPPTVVPECLKDLNLISENIIDLNSPIIKCGYLRMLNHIQIDPKSYAVRDGFIRIYPDGTINKSSQPYREGLKRLYDSRKQNKRGKGGGRRRGGGDGGRGGGGRGRGRGRGGKRGR